MPIHFYGNVTYIDGGIPPKGVDLIAIIDGEVRNNKPHPLPGDGKYGVLFPESFSNLVVLGSRDDNGKDITFELGNAVAAETYHISNWDDSAWDSPIRKNLTFDRITAICDDIEDIKYDIVDLDTRITALESE